MNLGGFINPLVLEFSTLNGFDSKQVNGAGKEVVVPKSCSDVEIINNNLEIKLPKLSWNMLRIKVDKN